ncbi:Os10g0167700 [Oryza sativa Japonica Group]|uniref:Os10g0167700 protein n=2 Tax=Oryza sativa subsp. japonica TaxID=39947 RepID=B9G7P4_ORYSJ|nr:hypothetical protein OsJ_30833 [Oryza sativa Japonica Group]KAF2912752.1 hypothetical protein DAI22_10g035800 [Oryza sativa Japonica Group]BAT10046.1 Os10g0167700 [Oryza sativa Japonica Group]
MAAVSWPPRGRRSGLGDGVSCAAGTHLSLAIFLASATTAPPRRTTSLMVAAQEQARVSRSLHPLPLPPTRQMAS